MDCKRRTAFTYIVSRLKSRASEKMGDLITNNEGLFFSLSILSVENRTSEDLFEKISILFGYYLYHDAQCSHMATSHNFYDVILKNKTPLKLRYMCQYKRYDS